MLDANTNLPSLPGFLEWLSRKDPNERYLWVSSQVCACGQYHSSLSEENAKNPTGWCDQPGVYDEINDLAQNKVSDDAEMRKGWNWGALLERVKAAHPELV